MIYDAKNLQKFLQRFSKSYSIHNISNLSYTHVLGIINKIKKEQKQLDKTNILELETYLNTRTKKNVLL